MAVRTPVYWDATLNSNEGGLRQMTSAQITEIVNQAAYQYSLNPSVTLNMSSGTAIGTQTDNYRVAGADSTNVSNYVTPGATGSFSTNYTMYQTVASLSDITLGSMEAPLYWTGSQLQEFSAQDFRDTFAAPAIDVLVAASGPGTYFLSSSAGSGTIAFSDSRFDASFATSANVDNDTYQNSTGSHITTNNTYRLLSYSGSSASFTVPAGWNSTSNHIQPLTDSNFQTLLQNAIRYQATLSSGGVRYDWATSAPSGATVNSRGSSVDQQLNGTTQFNKFINANDYRSRNFPTGSNAVQSTFTLYVIKTS